ncbi:MAG: membrane dipeptidase [Leptospirales bacterium]|nr:membrane dipeptidase [Leptospirales bacterium]
MAVIGCGFSSSDPEAIVDRLRQTALVDLHNDRSFFLTAREVPWSSCQNTSLCAATLRQGQYFFAVFRPPGPLRPGAPWHLGRQAVQRLNSESNFSYVERAAADLQQIPLFPVSSRLQELGGAQNRAFLALEGAFLLDSRIESIGTSKPGQLSRMLDRLKALQFSMVGLTWSNLNGFAGVAGDPGGLTEEGKWLVRALIQRGFIVDLSHASDQTVRDVYQLTRGQYPLIFSHSSARAICSHPRNLSDELIRLVATSGGLIGVNFHADYVRCSARAERRDVLEHLEHIRQVGNASIVALGGDLDGLIRVPRGLERPDDSRELAIELIGRGWTETEALGLLHANALRALTRAQSANPFAVEVQ